MSKKPVTKGEGVNEIGRNMPHFLRKKKKFTKSRDYLTRDKHGWIIPILHNLLNKMGNNQEHHVNKTNHHQEHHAMDYLTVGVAGGVALEEGGSEN